MSTLEHYFENLLFHGEDCGGEPNKSSLTKEQQDAVFECYQYVLYNMFYDRDNLDIFLHTDEYENVDDRFTMEELELLSSCLSSYVYLTNTSPTTIMNTAIKLEKKKAALAREKNNE